jgi:hypothetical protein
MQALIDTIESGFDRPELSADDAFRRDLSTAVDGALALLDAGTVRVA